MICAMLTPASKVENFNKKFPVGSDVMYTDDFGKKHHTKIRGSAWVMPSGDLVVLIEGKTGCYLAERISKE